MKPNSVLTMIVVWLAAIASARAASVPVGFKDQQIADGLTSPTALTALPDGRLLVVQQNGVIRTVKDDVMLADSYWEVPSVDSTYERGCLGITPDPSFGTNHYIYAFCTIKGESTSNNQVLRVTEVDGRADPSTLVKVLELPEVRVMFHMGGALRFGPDGMLYVAVGNHEDGRVDDSYAQELENPFGKILRVRPDGSVPNDNPFVDQPGAFTAIWSYGYRNPFAFDVQPGTGRMLVGEVGHLSWEEINDNKRGANYGWSVVEGPSDDPRYEAPLYTYEHTDRYCAITGGAFYNPKNEQFPAEFVGTFLFEDFCAGTLEVLDLTTAQARPFASELNYPTNLVVAPDGSVYYLSRNQDTKTHNPNVGTLSKISYSGTAEPRISKNPASQTVLLGEPVTFEVAVQDAAAIQWQRDGEDIPGAKGNAYTIEHTTAQDDGARFVARAKNDFGEVSSLAAQLTITTNRPPVAAIEGRERIEYSPGEIVTLKGRAVDPDDGDLPQSTFSWKVDYQHDRHTHPLLAEKRGSDSLTFMVPALEMEEANSWVRVELFVKDSDGATHSVSRDIHPRTQLSSLTPLDPIQNGLGPIELDRGHGGKPMSMDGVAFKTGLGVHAPSDVRFHLDGRCSGKFVAAVGLDDEVAERGSVVFQVFLDDKMVYESGLKRGSDDRENVVVDLAGSRQLRLVVADGGDGDTHDSADWGAARIMGCALAAEPAANDGMESGSNDKPNAAGSKSEPARSDSENTATKPAASEAAQASLLDASATSSSRNDPVMGDAGAKSVRKDDGGCSVIYPRANERPWFAWLALLSLSVMRWRSRSFRQKHARHPCVRAVSRFAVNVLNRQHKRTSQGDL
jgi:glucose/arabinose dehydrogenase